jgi:hypothetical protein
LMPSLGTRCHVLFLMRAPYSVSMAPFQSAFSIASCQLLGSPAQARRQT